MDREARPFSRRAFLAGLAAISAAPALATGTVARLAPSLDRILPARAELETIATGLRWAEGPLWLPRDGALLFSDPPANIVRRWTRRGGTSVFLQPSGAASYDPRLVREPGANGLALDSAGRLLIADSGSRALVRYGLATRRRTTLVDRYRGRRFNSPNDLAIGRDGTIWFTDPPYGLAEDDRSSAKELAHNGVYRWRAGEEVVLIDASLSRPNGIAVTPDGRRLFVSVSDPAAPRIMAYDLDARGCPRSARLFLDMSGWPGPGLPDGMKIAADGTMFCSGPGGMHVLSPDGERLGLIADGGPIANCAIGEGGRALFLAANHRILRLSLLPGASS